MAKRWLMALGLVAGGVIVPAGFASHANTAGSTIVQIPLPGPSSAEVRALGVTFAGGPSKGVAKLTAHIVNEAALGNASAVAVIESPSKPTAHGRYQVIVLIRQFAFDRVAAARSGQTTDLQIQWKWADGSSRGTIKISDKLDNCDAMRTLNTRFENGLSWNSPDGSFTDTLVSIRPRGIQPSPPEEVLDGVLSAAYTQLGCDAGALAPDDDSAHPDQP